MKKFYLLSLLCLLGIGAKAQTTVTLYPPVAPGMSGNVSGGVFTNDVIASSSVPGNSGYAVFNISGIPSDAVVMSVTLGYHINGYLGSGTASSFLLTGYQGDMSIVPAAAMSAAMTGATAISTASYGPTVPPAVPLDVTLASTLLSLPNLTNFIQACVTAGSSRASICWNGGGVRTYTIAGYTGPNVTAGLNHAPYLTIRYCTKQTAIVQATPEPVCENRTLTLSNSSSTGGGGTTTYQWDGPGGYSNTVAIPTITPVTMATAGIYSLTVSHNCNIGGAPAVTATVTSTDTTMVTVNPAPPAITGGDSVCFGSAIPAFNSITVANTDGTGTWSSSNTSVATINSGGVITSVSAGTTIISYSLSTGCYASHIVTVNNDPPAITGPGSVCEADTVSWGNTVLGGTWSSGTLTVAVIGTTGAGVADIVGVGNGSSTISYIVKGCPAETRLVTVNRAAGPITGGLNVCLNPFTSTQFSNSISGGTWSTSNTNAHFSSFPPSGRLVGDVTGTTTITYTTSSGCIATLDVDVDPALPPIAGSPTTICEGGITNYTNLTTGGVWSTANTTIATVDFAGAVTGVGAGAASITYTWKSCRDTKSVTVAPGPGPISGPTTNPCASDSFVVSIGTTGGRWSNSNSLIATLDSLSPSTAKIKAIAPGVLDDTVYYTMTTGQKCWSIYVLNVRPTPDATIDAFGAATTFCTAGPSSTVYLELSYVVGTSYQWYSNGVPIPSATTNSYTSSSSEVVTASSTNSSGCSSSTLPVTVVVGVNPTISNSGRDTFCTGSSTVLTAGAGGAIGSISYQWMLNGLNITGANSASYLATKGGNYMAVVKVAGSSDECIAPTPLYNVYVNPVPAPPITYSGKTLYTSNTYQSYQWLLNSNGIPGANSASYVPKINGSYRVLVTDTNGCGGYSTPMVINAVGVENVLAPEVKIYPNPATSTVYVESNVKVSATIFSLDGRAVLTASDARQIDISNLANGIYIMSVQGEQGERITTTRLIKE